MIFSKNCINYKYLDKIYYYTTFNGGEGRSLKISLKCIQSLAGVTNKYVPGETKSYLHD